MAPDWVSRVTRSAIRVRGQGHWPNVAQARFVDIHNRDRLRRRHPRLDPLVIVENLEAEGLKRCRVQDTHAYEGDQPDDPDGPPEPKPTP